MTGATLLEDELPDAIVPHPEARALRALHFATICVFAQVEEQASHASAIQAHLLVWAAARFLLAYQFQGGVEALDLYAGGYSPKGRRLLDHVGFRMVMPPRDRRDGLPLYRRSVSKGELAALIAELDRDEFCSRRCRLEFDLGAPGGLVALDAAATA